MNSPYMSLIGDIEFHLDVVARVKANPTNGVDSAQLDEYAENLLEVRDTLHRFRQAEMAEDPTERRERLKVVLTQVFDWK